MANMRTNQKLQSACKEIADITDLEVYLYTTTGGFVCSSTGEDDGLGQEVALFTLDEPDVNITREFALFKVLIDANPEYVLVLRGEHPEMLTLGKMGCAQIRGVVNAATGMYDRTNFIQNILLGNMLAVDMISYAKKLHVEASPRVAFVIDTGKKSNDMVIELVKNLSDLRAGDFVTSLDEHSVVLIKDVSQIAPKDLEEELEGIAASLVDSIHMEAMIRVRVGYGNVTSQLQELAQSYQEAKMALEVSRVFYLEHDTISYSKLGIGRLIYQLPMSLCDMYIKEVFGDKIPDILDDEEAMSTISMFFENNLNISETARQLYLHRNTLVYRLERIEKAIGLDIRKFDDALTFKIATMVIAHSRATREKGV